MSVAALTRPSLADASTFGRAFADLQVGIEELAASLRNGTLAVPSPPAWVLPRAAVVEVTPAEPRIGWAVATTFAREAAKTGVVVLCAYHALLWLLPDPPRPELGGAPDGASPVVVEVVSSVHAGAPLALEAPHLEVDRDGQATSGLVP